MKNRYLNIFSNVFIERGHQRALIQDVFQVKIFIIPLDLYHFINEFNLNDISKIGSRYNDKELIVINEYIEFLIGNKLASIENSKSIGLYCKLARTYLSKSMVENSIVYLHFDKKNELSSLVSDALFQIERLGCRALVLIVSNREPNVEILRKIEELIFVCNISYLEVIFQNDCINCSENDIFSLFMRQYGLVSVKIFSSSENKVINFTYHGQVFTNRKVEYHTQPFNNQNCCGLVIPFEFNLQLPHYLESQHHNTCLNRKIAIDAEGNIKNCPSMAKSYGNIRDTKLIDVVNNPEFQKVWHIKKDEITKCKDCEFRHICTDCRAYLENPEDMYSAPLKCGYDPYTCTWEKWSTNPLKEKAIKYYGMEDFIKD